MQAATGCNFDINIDWVYKCVYSKHVPHYKLYNQSSCSRQPISSFISLYRAILQTSAKLCAYTTLCEYGRNVNNIHTRANIEYTYTNPILSRSSVEYNIIGLYWYTSFQTQTNIVLILLPYFFYRFFSINFSFTILINILYIKNVEK